jgi:cell division septation protein DedD
MRAFWGILSLSIGFVAPAFGQGNFSPAEPVPAGFEGREYTDSRGCVFLRSTFGGAVTWTPRYGPDRQPVCDGTPSVAAPPAAALVVPVVAPAPVPVAAPTPRAAQTPRRPATARTLARADASGRHPDCPEAAPYGQLVDTLLGRPLVRCVTSPSQFLNPVDNGAGINPNAPIALPDSLAQRTSAAVQPRAGRVVQVASFAIPANAAQLNARLQRAGLPARNQLARGYHVVTLGPFASGAEAQAALAQARRMGFADAFLR